MGKTSGRTDNMIKSEYLLKTIFLLFLGTAMNPNSLHAQSDIGLAPMDNTVKQDKKHEFEIFKDANMYPEFKEKEYDRTQMWKFLTGEQIAEQHQPDLAEQYKISPPLRPERFRRRIKMLLGIDINNYPKKVSLIMPAEGSPWLINLDTQIFSLYDPYIEYKKQYVPTPPEENPYADWESEQGPDRIFVDPPDSTYGALRKFALFNDLSGMNALIDYRHQQMKELARDPENHAALEVFSLETEVSLDLLNNLYNNALFILDFKVIEYMMDTRIDNVRYPLMDNRQSTPDVRQDMIWLNVIKSEKKYFRFYEGGWNINKLRDILSPPTENSPNVLGDKFNANRSAASLLAFYLRLEKKDQNKFVIQFMSGQLDRQMWYPVNGSKRSIGCKKIISDIISNNYYGYSILREFLTNPMREMPTLEKIGTNFQAQLLVPDNALLLLEPFSDSFDIDTVYPDETFKAYEMGHDNYYFIEIKKPVESPVADEDGYAMIIDRFETVYGYLPKEQVKAHTSRDVSEESRYNDRALSYTGVIQDKDGYVYKDRIREKYGLNIIMRC